MTGQKDATNFHPSNLHVKKLVWYFMLCEFIASVFFFFMFRVYLMYPWYRQKPNSQIETVIDFFRCFKEMT